MTTILVTGNLGYIGSVLTPMLIEEDYRVIGYDIGYYDDDCRLGRPSNPPHRQIQKDIRDVTQDDLAGVDAVIHLAALSNDPLGEFNPELTREINYEATIRLAQHAKTAGVKRFVYASSQSMYGVAKGGDVKEDSKVNPITMYAKTKWESECKLKELADDDFTVVCLRPSTVFGASPKLRCDIVYNNFLACAYTTKKIEIKSDGAPWRPVIHIKDVSKAFMAGLAAPSSIVNRQSYNVGIQNGNFQVRDLAEAARKIVPGCDVVYTKEHGPDSRTYKVSFGKILTELKGYYHPEWDLIRGGEELIWLFDEAGFTEEDFRGRRCIRLQQLQWLVGQRRVDEKLRRSKSGV